MKKVANVICQRAVAFLHARKILACRARQAILAPRFVARDCL